MLTYIFSFLLGVLLANKSATLPNIEIILLFSCISIVITLKYSLLRRVTIGTCIGYLYLVLHATIHMQFLLPKSLEQKPIKVNGYISSIPNRNLLTTSFYVRLTTINSSDVDTLIKLSYQEKYKKIQFHVGEKWQLLVKLKKIHGNASDGAFDYEAWALQKGIRAEGTIIDSDYNKLLFTSTIYSLNAIRQNLIQKIAPLLPNTKTARWIVALLIGEKIDIDSKHWEILRNTGTNHLMAIAGLHIGILTGFIYKITEWLVRYFPIVLLYIPASKVAAIVSLIGSFIYSVLAGFSLPTQRAFIMIGIFLLSKITSKKINPWSIWSLALILVLFFNPLSTLTESFWLSFCTIALIIYCMRGRLKPDSFWWHYGRIQWIIGFGLIPLTLLLYQEASISSFIANCIAIPVLSFLILPFCLLGAVISWFSTFISTILFNLADINLTYLWLFLSALSQLPFSTWHLAVPIRFSVYIFISFIFLLSPKNTPLKLLGVIFLTLCLLYKPKAPHHNEILISQLDVGQGLATIVQTKHHTLLFDTGAAIQNKFDAGENIIIPFLRANHIKKIDRLVISHGDNDHIGGAFAVMRTIPILSYRTSVPDKLLGPLFSNYKNIYCFKGETWTWDNVRFTFLHPDVSDLNLGNDSSCVLKIDNGNKSILLTGDIEHYAETKLVKTASALLASDVLVAPHHGSKTSGDENFVNLVNPKYVIYATGYLNRYKFPHESIVRTYQAKAVKQFNTADLGTLQILLNHEVTISNFRTSQKKYWMD